MNFEALRSGHFLNSENEELWRTWMERALNIALDVVRQRPDAKICSDIPLTDLEQVFSDTEFPEQGLPLEPLFRDTVEKVVRHSVRVSDPRFVGHMTGATPFMNIALDILISALNQNVVKIETALAGSFVEKQTIAWLHRMVYDRSSSYYRNIMHSVDKTLGNATNGGTMGNLTALTVARNSLLPEAATDGLAASMVEKGLRRLVILASRRVHYSVRKAANILGIGSKNVLEIPVRPQDNHIDLGALENTLAALERHKTGVLAIIGIAGTTETGSIDDLASLAKLARDRGIWFHVDAAWGGPLLLSQKHRSRLAGIGEADSVTIDGHKLFYLNLNHGAVLFRNEKSLDSVRHSANYIIRPGSVDLGRTSLEGSRRFDSFKLWFLLRALGREGFATLVERSLELAANFGRQVESHPSFELTSATETNILTYRFLPSRWKEPLLELRHRLDPCLDAQGVIPAECSLRDHAACARFATEFLNDINTELHKRQRMDGRSFVSRTTLESVFPGSEVVVLRAVIMNPFTTSELLAEMLAEQARLGQRLASERWKRVAVLAPERFCEFFGSLPDVSSDFLHR